MEVAHGQVAENRARLQVLEGRRALICVPGQKVAEKLVLFGEPVQPIDRQGQVGGVGVVNPACTTGGGGEGGNRAEE